VHRLRAYGPALILAAGCGLLWKAHAQKGVPLVSPLSGVLARLDGYVVVDQTLSDEERRVAGMTDYVARVYMRDSAVAFTTLVSYYDRQAQGKTIHSPRNCLPGAGWEILSPGKRTLTVDRSQYVVNSFVLKNGSHIAITYYWYQGRGRVASSEYAVKWNLLRDAALLGHTEEALVRVVVPVGRGESDFLPSSSQAAYAVGDDIAEKLLREVKRVLPEGTDVVARVLPAVSHGITLGVRRPRS
jgi:EpsI family protein